MTAAGSARSGGSGREPAVARRVGYVTADVGALSAEQLVELLGRAGYDAVEWTMEQVEPLEGPAELVRICGLARDAGLATPQLMVHQDYVTPDPALWEERVRRSEAAVEAAAAAGIASIGVLTGPNRWVHGHPTVVAGDAGGPDGADGPAGAGGSLTEDAAWTLALRALERVLTRAESAGVRVALEPCWGTLARDRRRTEHLLSRLASPALALTLDPSHFVMTGDDVPALVRDHADRIAHVHLKDAFGREGVDGEDFTFLLPGEGKVDWPGLLGALDATGYAGALCVEFESFPLLEGPLGGSVERGAALARELVAGLLDGPRM